MVYEDFTMAVIVHLHGEAHITLIMDAEKKITLAYYAESAIGFLI